MFLVTSLSPVILIVLLLVQEALAVAAAVPEAGAAPVTSGAAPTPAGHYPCDGCSLVFGCKLALIKHKKNKHADRVRDVIERM